MIGSKMKTLLNDENSVAIISFDEMNDPPTYQFLLNWFEKKGITPNINTDRMDWVGSQIPPWLNQIADENVFFFVHPFFNEWVTIIFKGKKGRNLAALFKLTFM